MASRMLHYVIALEVAKEFNIESLNDFVVGALLPDASSHSDGSYNRAHFGFWKVEPAKGIDWLEFLRKYDCNANSVIYLGYLCHLIADAVWFKQITDKYIRIYPHEEKKQIIKQGYQDFWKLNAILIREYGLEKPELHIPTISIDEIDADLIEDVCTYFKKDFNEAGQYEAGDLEVYPYEAIKAFIDESKELCVHEFMAIKGEAEFADPRSYFVATTR